MPRRLAAERRASPLRQMKLLGEGGAEEEEKSAKKKVLAKKTTTKLYGRGEKKENAGGVALALLVWEQTEHSVV